MLRELHTVMSKRQTALHSLCQYRLYGSKQRARMVGRTVLPQILSLLQILFKSHSWGATHPPLVL